ncbi:hypothetical protein AA313_de0205461 [Arthrobotrys entomopaga]|nr:hypothetical protein AA313_de0205461 [Arthrobotrys entomopaga]
MQRTIYSRLLTKSAAIPLRPTLRPLVARQWPVVARHYASLPESHNKLLTAALEDADPTVAEIVKKEKQRQREFINLIPSENFTSQAVLDTLGSPMQSAIHSLEYSHVSNGRPSLLTDNM